jgi:predicted phosphodiesterase
MRYAIMSDIHGNLEAFEAVLADSKNQGCTHYAFLGDFVGYCADPKRCLDIIRGINAPCVKGNHDDLVSLERLMLALTPAAAKMIQWTRKQLKPDDLEWLRKLPLVINVANFTMVHATLERPERWGYVYDSIAAGMSMNNQTTSVCFCGHTHVPMAFIRDTVVRGGTFTKLRVEEGRQYFVNFGAVGQPRDNNPDAAYGIYDLAQGTLELRRCAYDVHKAQRKIRQAGLDTRSSH